MEPTNSSRAPRRCPRGPTNSPPGPEEPRRVWILVVPSGADQVVTGPTSCRRGSTTLSSGAQALSAGLAELDSSVQSLPEQTAELADGSGEVAAALDGAAAALDSAAGGAAAVVDTICQDVGPLCDQATAVLQQLEQADDDVAALPSGADQVAAGNAQLADGMPDLVEGIDSSATGAAEVAGGADKPAAGGTSLTDGAGQVADGADSSATGAASVAEGADSLASGADQVDTGAEQLSAGLGEAVGQIPTYSVEDISTLSRVVATPATAQFASPSANGSVSLFAVVALWIGGIVIALGHSAVAASRLLTSRSSVSLALDTCGRVAAVGAGQGVLVGLVLLGFVEGGSGWGLVASSVAVGATFAVVNTGLAALLGGFGRMLAAIVTVVTLVVGTSSTAPPALEAFAALVPTAPAHTIVLATTGAAVAWVGALVLLVVWAVLSIGMVVGGTTRRRHGPGLLAGQAG